MGVVYKLYPEIKEKIIEFKRKDPTLSCRGLKSILTKQFKLHLSKSSINTLIKEAGLSNSVGRRKIKPSEIFRPLTGGQDQLKELVSKSTPFNLLSTEEKKLLPILRIDITQPSVTQRDSLIQPPSSDLEIEAETAQLIEIKEDKVFDALGSFFLKAAEFELADRPILSKILQESVKAEVVKESGFLSDALLFLPLFGIKQPNEISNYQGQGLWVLAQEKKPSMNSISGYLKQLESIKGLSLTIHSKCTQLFHEVNFLKFTLEDNTVFYIDGRFKSVWTEPNTSGLLSATYYKTISYINNLFLNNVQSVVLFTAGGYNAFSNAVSEFIFACEGIPDKRIVKIALYDTQDKDIHTFLNIPHKKRYFVFGFWPWHREFRELLKKEDRPLHSFYAEDINRDIYYHEAKVELLQHLVDKRVILRFALIKDAPMTLARIGLLTNIPQEDKSIDEIIQLYFQRWPNLEESYQDFLKRSQRLSFFGGEETQIPQRVSLESVYTLGDSTVTIWDEISYILNELSKYAQKHFFPAIYNDADFSTMKKRFYSLPGYLKKRENRLLITLLIPEDYAFYPDLLYALRRFNESDIQDNLQVKISFNMPRKALS